MKEPSEKDIKKEKQSELDKIAETNAKCVAGYQVIRNTVFNNISDGDLTKMNKYIKAEYGKVYTGLKGMIIDALNDAKDKNVKLVEKLLDESLPPAKHYEVLPKTPAFKWTNRVFTEKSVSVRSQKAADAITKIIADGRNDGLAIPDIQKKIDIVMGFRDAQGRLTDKSKKLIEAGKFTHRNGSIYETYRIARTEVMRMNAFAKYNQFEELRKKYPNARLKLIATLDDRTRTQSREMNGQISNAKGEFLYPDAKYYRLGTAPAQWCINDREVQYIVFLTDKEEKSQEKQEEKPLSKEEIIKASETQTSLLNAEQKQAIATYTGNSTDNLAYKKINTYLRGETTKLPQKYKDTITQIENAFKQASLPDNMALYRGVGNDFIEKQFGTEIANIMEVSPNNSNLIKAENILLGRSYTEKGFMSTSYDIKKSFDKSVLLQVNAPKGIKALAVDKISELDEAEVLINKGYRWKISKIEITKNKRGINKWKLILDLI